MSGGKKLFVACSWIAVAALSLVSVEAQKKGGPAPTPQHTSVAADFRCPGAADCLTATRVDRITGDGAGPYVGTYVGSTTGQGAFLNEFNKLAMRYTTSYGRSIFADFRDRVASGTCGANCRKSFDIADVRATPYPSITNPVDASQEPLPGGFYDIPVGGSSEAHYKLDFADPAGRALVWTVRFNAEYYPGSSNVTVTRTSENTWEVEAGVNDIAELVAINSGKGKQAMTHEGFYTMPFKITVTR